MPVCFRLYAPNSSEPANLAEVDNKICELFNETPHETNWFRGWFNVIGFRLALGDRKEELMEDFKEHEFYGKIVEWIFDNFRVESFREV